jgi:protein O-mannosyl-transferase
MDSAQSEKAQRRNQYIAAGVLALCLLGALIYSNTFHSPFLFDSELYIANNAGIRDLGDLKAVWDISPTRFLCFLSFALNYSLHKLEPAGYHAVNLGIHLAAALLLWWLVRLTLASPLMKDDPLSRRPEPAALLCALVFLSHPLQTEAVTYVYQRVASLGALFYILSICMYARARTLESAGHALKGWAPPYMCAWLAALAAMFTKEHTITLPAMIVLYEFCFFGAGPGGRRRALPFLALLPVIPLTLFFSRSGIVYGDVENFAGSPGRSLDYALTQPGVVASYLRMLLWPAGQNLDHDITAVRTALDPAFLSGLLLNAVILAAAAKLFNRRRLLSFAVFWFFLALLPESSVVPMQDAMFEHRLYLPMAGYAAFLVCGLFYAVRGRPRLAAGILLAVVACNSLLAYRRNAVWKDALTLWDDAVLKSPHKARPYNNRGIAWQERGETNRAFADYNTAVYLKPDYAEARNNIGVILAIQGKLEEAGVHFRAALRLKPDYASAHNNYGLALAVRGRPEEAIAHFQEALRLKPDYAEAHDNWGIALARQGKTGEAVAHFREVLRLDPECAQAHYNLGIALSGQGKAEEAAAHYREALRLKPDYWEAHYNLGSVLSRQGKAEEAAEHYREAARIRPGFAGSRNRISGSEPEK